MRTLAAAALQLGIQSKPQGPGVWVPFQREQDAPTTLSNYMDIRTNSLYKSVRYVNNVKIYLESFALGTGGDQPEDKDDERDERCVAIKDVGNPDQGHDPFPCDPDDTNNYMKHYAICLTYK